MKIVISNIKGYFPSDYDEQKYIDSSKHRVKQDGQDIVIFKTPTKHKVKNDQTYRNRKIQSVFYDKYSLEFFVTESTNIDLLSVAETVTVILDNGEIHNAELLDVPTYEKLQDSDFKRVTIYYRDLDSKVTVNHLILDSETDSIATLKAGITNIYTPIYCDFDFTEYERTENSDNGITLVSSESGFNTIKFFAYVTDDFLTTIKKGINAKYLQQDEIYITYDGTTYNALEVPEIEVLEDDFEGIKGIIVTLKYNQELNYPFIEQEVEEITISANPDTLNFSYNDTETLISQITTNGENGWMIDINQIIPTWINYFKNGDNLEIYVDETTTYRTGNIYVVSMDDNSKKATVSIVQTGTSSIELSSNSLSWDLILNFPSEKSVTVITSDPLGWDIISISDEWITATKDGNLLKVDITNSTSQRSGTVTVANESDSSQQAILTIYQGYTRTRL